MRPMSKEEFVARMLSDIRAREQKEKEMDRVKRYTMNGYLADRSARFERYFQHCKRR